MKPNILFLVIDSFRSDMCFGEKKTSVTPNIDKLIKNGTYFPQTISSASGTFLASASILTSLFPFEAIMSDKKRRKLHSKTDTFIKYAKQHGYHTHAIVPTL